MRGRYFVVDQNENKIVGTGHYDRKSAERAMTEQAYWSAQRSDASEMVGPLLDQIDALDHPIQKVEIVEGKTNARDRSR